MCTYIPAPLHVMSSLLACIARASMMPPCWPEWHAAALQDADPQLGKLNLRAPSIEGLNLKGLRLRRRLSLLIAGIRPDCWVHSPPIHTLHRAGSFMLHGLILKKCAAGYAGSSLCTCLCRLPAVLLFIQNNQATYLTVHKDTRPALVQGNLSCPCCSLVGAALHDQPVIHAWLGRPVRQLPIPWSHLQSSWQLICWHVHSACMPCQYMR